MIIEMISKCPVNIILNSKPGKVSPHKTLSSVMPKAFVQVNGQEGCVGSRNQEVNADVRKNLYYRFHLQLLDTVIGVEKANSMISQKSQVRSPTMPGTFAFFAASAVRMGIVMMPNNNLIEQLQFKNKVVYVDISGTSI